MTDIGESAFEGCVNLRCIDLPPDLEELRKSLFGHCNFSVLAFESLLWLSSIQVSACESNRALRSVLIPGSVITIHGWAFRDCVSLSEVNFVSPSQLRSIDFESFSGCKSLTQFRIVGSVQAISGSFIQGSGVHEVFVDGDNDHFDTLEGFLVNRAGTSIVSYFGKDSDVQIGRNIESIEEHSFEKCAFLRSVTFETGSKLAAIGTFAFQMCQSLERVQFGGSYPRFGFCCFGYCQALREVLEGSRTQGVPFGSSGFLGCWSLKGW
jgi:hypothetical protein